MKTQSIMRIALVGLLLLLPYLLSAQEKQSSKSKTLKNTKYGLGFQGTFPANGLSGVMNLTDKTAAQAIIGFFGSLNTFAARGLYRFQQKNFWNAYGYGMIGIWTYSGLEFVRSRGRLEETTEAVFGFGAGAGIEYDWRALSADLPPIAWNLELGLGFVDFDRVDFSFSTILFGAGIHYRF